MTTKSVALALTVCVASTLALGCVLATLTGETHWVNRAGALIAAIAALSGYAQLRVELSLAQHLAADTPLGSVSQDRSGVGPIERLRLRLRSVARERARERADAERLHLAASVVAVASFGELIHGFGDVIFELVVRLVHAF